jgi:5-(carboxyamino)imidazole ribonucleotide synthase
MVNILGKHLAHLDIAALSAIPGMKLHLYGKTRIEPKRKMGHLTILRETPAEVMDALAQVEGVIVNPPLEQIQHPIARATGQH